MNVDEVVFLIARFDLLLFALCLLFAGILLWLPSHERRSRRQLLLGRYLAIPLGLLVGWFTLTNSDLASLSPGTLGRMYVLVFATPLVILFTFMVAVSLLVAVERALGHDVKRYRPLREAMNRWGQRVLGVHRLGAVEAGRDRKVTQKLAQKLAARKGRRKKTPSSAAKRPSSVGPARSRQ